MQQEEQQGVKGVDHCSKQVYGLKQTWPPPLNTMHSVHQQCIMLHPQHQQQQQQQLQQLRYLPHPLQHRHPRPCCRLITAPLGWRVVMC